MIPRHGVLNDGYHRPLRTTYCAGTCSCRKVKTDRVTPCHDARVDSVDEGRASGARGKVCQNTNSCTAVRIRVARRYHASMTFLLALVGALCFMITHAEVYTLLDSRTSVAVGSRHLGTLQESKSTGLRPRTCEYWKCSLLLLPHDERDGAGWTSISLKYSHLIAFDMINFCR